MAEDVSDKVTVKQDEASCVVSVEKARFHFWRYGETDGLRANINASQEVYFGTDVKIRNTIQALEWYLANKEQVPELVRVRGRGLGRVLYGVRADQADTLVTEGKAYRNEDGTSTH